MTWNVWESCEAKFLARFRRDETVMKCLRNSRGKKKSLKGKCRLLDLFNITDLIILERCTKRYSKPSEEISFFFFFKSEL